jgi:hypothetical protein
MAGPNTSLDESSILEEARSRAGLGDFGDESFREPLRRTLHAFETEAGLNEGGRLAQRERTIGLLVNRLRIEDWLRRHPEILDEKINAPIVIAGLPRTGTTMLHRVISQDPGIFAGLWYELRNPAPFPEGDFRKDDPRVADAEAQVAQILESAPDLAAIHPWDHAGADEEIMLLEYTFLSTMALSAAYVPKLARWIAEQDQRPAYRYLEKVLKFLQWQKRAAGQRGERWVLKAPYHLNFIDVLFEVFPDAVVVQTHRDPLETIPSYASMSLALWRLAADDPDPVAVGREWGGWFRGALQRCLELRESRFPDRFIDVWYEDALRDPIGEVRRIYAVVGRELTSVAEARMRRWLRDNSRDKRAPHEYSMDSFAFTRAQLERDFAGYRERFILSRERAPRVDSRT